MVDNNENETWKMWVSNFWQNVPASRRVGMISSFSSFIELAHATQRNAIMLLLHQFYYRQCRVHYAAQCAVTCRFKFYRLFMSFAVFYFLFYYQLITCNIFVLSARNFPRKHNARVWLIGRRFQIRSYHHGIIVAVHASRIQIGSIIILVSGECFNICTVIV